MSEFSYSPNTANFKKTKTKFSSLLLSDLFLFCSFIISHPLYFSYFVFFSPYIIKILSFLSPLFITTSLLLLALFTTLVHDNSCIELSEKSKVSFLLAAYHNVLEKLRTNADHDENDGFRRFEELEAYKIVFDTSSIEVREGPVEIPEMGFEENGLSTSEAPVDKHLCHESVSANSSQGLSSSNANEVSLADIMRAESESESESESSELIAGGKRLGGFLKGDNDFVDVPCEKGEKKVKALSVEFNKVEEQKVELSGSKGTTTKISEAKVSSANGAEYLSKLRVNSRRVGDGLWSNDNDGEYNWKNVENSQNLVSNLGSFGSMRKEKEWRRTLACKLFEERHNAEGSEGMDSLWEAYETDSNKQQQRLLAKSKTKKGKKGGTYEDVVVADDDEVEMDDGQLCCLQALKFSAGKMNLGMGRPNLVKISKALKGIGWLHNVTKHGKKFYH